jgi:AraC-like DNA-binding protein
MTNNRIIQIDSVDAYNKLYGWKTLHPLVTVVNISKETGITCQHHIQDAVIDRSKLLLLETKLPISEIAYQLGFQYSQHFTRLFKAKTGMTPNQYRMTA